MKFLTYGLTFVSGMITAFTAAYMIGSSLSTKFDVPISIDEESSYDLQMQRYSFADSYCDNINADIDLVLKKGYELLIRYLSGQGKAVEYDINRETFLISARLLKLNNNLASDNGLKRLETMTLGFALLVYPGKEITTMQDVRKELMRSDEKLCALVLSDSVQKELEFSGFK